MSGPDPSPLAIRLLGTFQLIHDGKTIDALGRPRMQALLGYLLLYRATPIARQRLAFLFWPDSSEKQAQTNLRNLLYKLRQALPNPDLYLHLTRDTVQWRGDAPVVLDSAQFENALELARQAGEAGNRAQEQASLAQAIDVYHGDLLPDLYDDWVLAERERLGRQYAAALTRLAALFEDRRDYRAALETAQKLRRHDPLREDTYRLLMRLHALNGDRTAALRAYHDCVSVLEEELAAEPGPVTQRAYRRLLKLTQQPEVVLPVQAMVGHVPLVGRRQEWQALLRAWQQARRGRPRVALILGEAGIGKTRLAEELLDWARRQGITTASARAYEAEGDMAYAPLADWLRSPALGPALAQLDDVWAREVARLVPEVLAGRPGLEPPGPLTERWQRQRFFEALARAVLTGTQPLLLHLDDLQWCDGETLAWLGFLLRYDRAARLLVVGTVRSENIDGSRRLTPWLAAMRQAGVITEIDLGPLDAAESAALAARVVGQELGAAQAEAFYAETEGNPLFVVETARMRSATGVGPRDLSSLSATSRMRAVLEARLAQLSPPARELAGVAAVIGREFSYGVLAAAGTVNEDTLMLGLEELWQRRIVRDRGADAYDFSHDKLREAAYAGLSPVRRRLLHRRVAEALEVVCADRLDEISGEVGVHFKQARDLARARVYLQRAGAHAAAQYANDEAVSYFTSALDMTSHRELAARYDLLQKREQVYALQTEQESRRADLLIMSQLADSLDDDRRRADVAMRTAQLEHELGQAARAIAFAERGITLAAAAGDSEIEAACLMEWSKAQLDLGTLRAAWDGYQRVLSLARSKGLLEVEARSLHGLSRVAVDQGDWDSCRFFDAQALSLYQELGDKRGEAIVLRHMGVVDELDGHPIEGQEKQLRAQRLVREIGFVRLEAWIASDLAWCSLMLGRHSQALSENDEALQLAGQVEDRSVEAMILNDRVEILHQVGDFAIGLETAQLALTISQDIGNRLREANSWANIGLMFGDLGKHAESAQAYEMSHDIYREQGNSVAMLRTRAGLARSMLARAEVAQACSLVDKIFPAIGDATKVISQSDGGAAILLTCYRVLRAANDPRAADALMAAHGYAQDRAARISDSSLRRSFLENIREVHAIVRAFKQEMALQEDRSLTS